jgi:hypothetical protein
MYKSPPPPEREGHDAPNTKTQVTCFYKQVNSFYDTQGPELNLQTFKFFQVAIHVEYMLQQRKLAVMLVMELHIQRHLIQ